MQILLRVSLLRKCASAMSGRYFLAENDSLHIQFNSFQKKVYSTVLPPEFLHVQLPPEFTQKAAKIIGARLHAKEIDMFYKEFDYLVTADGSVSPCVPSPVVTPYGFGSTAVVLSMSCGKLHIDINVYRATKPCLSIQDAELLPIIASLSSIPDGSRVRVNTDQLAITTFYNLHDGFSMECKVESWKKVFSQLERFKKAELVYVQSHGPKPYSIQRLCDRLSNKVREELIKGNDLDNDSFSGLLKRLKTMNFTDVFNYTKKKEL